MFCRRPGIWRSLFSGLSVAVSPDGFKLKLALLACTGRAARDVLCKLAGGQNSRLVSDSLSSRKRRSWRQSKAKVLNRQEFISHPLENPSQNTCDLQTECLLSWGIEKPDDSLQASFLVVKERSTAAIFLRQISLPTASFTSLTPLITNLRKFREPLLA